MKWFALSSIAAVSLLLPVSTYAAQSHLSANNMRGESVGVMSESLAQTPPERPGREGRQGGDRNPMDRFQQLDLTTEQSQQIQAIFQQSKTENESLRQQMEAAREQMESLMSGNATADQLRQQHNTMQNLHQQLDNRRFETMLQIREILTPQQRARLAELKPPQRRMGQGGM